MYVWLAALHIWCVAQGAAAEAQGFLIRLLQIGFAAGSLVAIAILLLQVGRSCYMCSSVVYHLTNDNHKPHNHMGAYCEVVYAAIPLHGATPHDKLRNISVCVALQQSSQALDQRLAGC